MNHTPRTSSSLARRAAAAVTLVAALVGAGIATAGAASAAPSHGGTKIDVPKWT